MVENARYNGKASFEEWKKDWELEERYNFKSIESKWQKIWDDEKAYKVEINHEKTPPFIFFRHTSNNCCRWQNIPCCFFP